MKHLILIAAIMIFDNTVLAQMRPRQETKWDQLSQKSYCLAAPVPDGIKLKDGYVPQVRVNSRVYWIDSDTQAETENPWFSSDPAQQEAARRNQFAFNGPGGGECPLGLSQRTTKDISWKRASGENVTVTIQETYKCTDNPRAVKFTRQKVFVKHDPATAANANPNSREEDAIIAEGIRLTQEEASRRLDNTELDYSTQRDVRDIYNFDAIIGGYLTNANCTGGNSRIPSQETAATRFCQTRESALLAKAGTLTERDRQCPNWLPRTISELRFASQSTPACTGTSIMPGLGEVSKCALPPGFNGQVGQESSGCRILSLNSYPNGYRDVSISCTPGTLPRLPGSTTAATVALPRTTEVTPVTGAQ